MVRFVSVAAAIRGISPNSRLNTNEWKNQHSISRNRSIYRTLLAIVILLLGYNFSFFVFNNFHFKFFLHSVSITTSQNLRSVCLTSLKPEEKLKVPQCSRKNDSRRPGQKVVAYSFYGAATFPKDGARSYFAGIWPNVETVQKFYPGWTIRVYHDNPISNFPIELLSLWCDTPFLDLCDVKGVPSNQSVADKFGMIWRFLPMEDPSVDIFISRDLDSEISQRELDAVNEWLSSNKTFHVMRDHPHHFVPILGGMWGAKVHRRRQMCDEVVKGMIEKANVSVRGKDQQILGTDLWPKIQGDVMVHDSYFCTNKGFNPFPSTPFPSQRPKGELNFVGSHSKWTLNVTCPRECRPTEHQDWEYC